MRKSFNKVVATLLSLCVVIGMIPATALASVNYDETVDDYYNVINKDDYDIAPGISESEIVLNNDEGTRRQVLHVMEVDVNNPYAYILPSSKGMTPTPGEYGVQVMSEQAAWAEENWGINVVGAMNISLSWYNSTYYTEHPELVGEPLGYLILNGEYYENSNGPTSGAQTCLVVNYDEKDGETRPADLPKTQIRSTSDPITGWEEQVIPANFGFIVKDGKNVYTKENHGTGASRSMLGLKEDGTVVMVMNDGRQSPYSEGLTDWEMGEMMLSLGCVYAINGDGGGSSTFLSQRPGEELKVNCSPSDGAERPTTHGVLVVSTAPATGEFVRANISSDNDYYTPNSKVEFSAVGTDLVGTSADIPGDAIWQLKDDSFGTIDNSGVFTSNGKVGDVVIQMVYNDEVVGEDTIHIVQPDTISLGQSVITAPYGKNVPLDVTALYEGSKVVTVKDGDISITLSDDNMGTINGIVFTATEDTSVTTGTITAKLNADENVKVTVEVNFGKGSEVLFDFEGETAASDWVHFPTYNIKGKIEAVTKENGQVRNGNGALAVTTDYTQVDAKGGWVYYGMNTTCEDVIIPADATSFGMWVYVPEEATAGEIDFRPYHKKSDGTYSRIDLVLFGNGYATTLEESGWQYVSCDISSLGELVIPGATNSVISNGQNNAFIEIYNPDSSNSGYGYNANEYKSLNGKFTYYFDDMTIDFSTAVDDREEPVFEYMNVAYAELDESVAVGGQTINYNKVIFSAKATEDTTKSNYTGLNTTSAKAFVDGIDLTDKMTIGPDGSMYLSEMTLTDGVHTVKFTIEDQQGNNASIIRQINIQAESGMPTVKVVPKDSALDKILIGSLYYMDVVATDVEKVQEVTVKIDLNNINNWEPEGMVVADGFEAECSVDSLDNIATVKITRSGKVESTGEVTLVSLPARTWEADYLDYKDTYTPEYLWSKQISWSLDLQFTVLYGALTLVDGTDTSFSAEKLYVDTENYAMRYTATAEYWKSKTCWHTHTATAIEDVAATCTENGYTGRTFCEGCNSVVVWGTTEKALGHDYQVGEGVLSCTHCKDKYNGELGGKTYINGVIADGWVDDTYYYVDGVKLTGSHFIEGKMYTFDDKGVYLPDYKFDGFYEINDTVMYFVGNEYVTGNQRLMGEYYNFDKNGIAYDGEVVIGGITCLFEDGLSVATDTVKTAGICGADAQFVMTTDGTMYICGSGDMDDYTSVGSNPWYIYEYRSKITTVKIGKDITCVGKRAFQNSPKLTTVIFEEGSALKSLHTHSFSQCPKLTVMNLPEGLEEIQDAAFIQSSGLTEMYMPDSLVKIGGYTFGDTLPEGLVMSVVKDSKAHKYAEYHGINYEIRESVVDSGSCGENATWEFYSTGKLVISGSGAIADYTYAKYGEDAAPWTTYRADITSIVIGKDITAIGTYNFYNCTALESVVFEAGSKLESIGIGAFGYCGMTTITLPASLKTIDKNAFYFSALETVEFEANSNLETIGECAFRNCEALQSVYIPEYVSSIGAIILHKANSEAQLLVAKDTYSHNYAIKNNYNVIVREATPVVMYSGTCGENAAWALYDNGTMEISGSGAIADYTYAKYGEDAAPWTTYRTKITKLVIGKDITAIGTYNFYNCTALDSVVFEAGSKLESIGIGAFGYCGMTTITLPASLKTIDKNAFYFSALEKVEFEADSVLETIGEAAFRNCTALQSVYVPEYVSSIGAVILLKTNDTVQLLVAEDTYAHKYAVKNGYNVVIRDASPAVLYNGTCGENATWALYDNGMLKIAGSGVVSDYAYNKYGDDAAPWAVYRSKITSIVIGKDITAIGTYNFYNCTALESVVFEAGSKLESIGIGAFGYCGMTTITLPASLKTIDKNAFYFSALETVEFEADSNLETIGECAFRNCMALKSVYVPDAVAKIGGVILHKANSEAELLVAKDTYAYNYAVKNNYNVVVR